MSDLGQRPTAAPDGGTGSLLDAFRTALASLPPAPRFDQIAVSDLRPFTGIERRATTDDLARSLPLALLGFPVVLDPEVEVGVIELRKGDEVVERVLLAELRA